MDVAFLTARKDALEARIVQYETAIAALQDATVESYTLDTGQTTQKVTRADVDRLQATLDGMLSSLSDMCNRLSGTGVFIGRPAF